MFTGSIMENYAELVGNFTVFAIGEESEADSWILSLWTYSKKTARNWTDKYYE